MLIMLYSDVENNFQITKNIIIKNHIYQNSEKKNIIFNKKIDKNIELLKTKNLYDTIFKINSCEQFVVVFSNVLKREKQ